MHTWKLHTYRKQVNDWMENEIKTIWKLMKSYLIKWWKMPKTKTEIHNKLQKLLCIYTYFLFSKDHRSQSHKTKEQKQKIKRVT